MKRSFIAILTIIFFCQTSDVLAQMKMNNELDSLSYAIGVNIGQSLQSQKLKPNTDLLVSAINDVLTNSELSFPATEASAFIQQYFQKESAKIANENLAIGKEYLAKNKQREGVIVTTSGLQYEIITEGSGPKPVSTDKVQVHYHGTLIDGTVFDSSVDRGAPSTFGVTQVIEGWVEGLQLMPTGSKWRFCIPSELAYGTRGQGKIGPNAMLIFDVELIEILN